MAQYVEYNGEVIEFPDNMSDSQIAAALKGPSKAAPSEAPTEAQKPSMASELGRQVGLTARAGITGAAALPAMVADPIANMVNLATGKQTMKPLSQAISGILDTLGLPKPQGKLEEAVQAGAGAMAGTGLQAAAAKGVPMLAGLAKELPKQFAASAAGGTAGQAAAQTVGEATQDPWASLAAGIVTGTLAGGLGGKAVDTANAAKGILTGTTKPTMTMDEIKTRAQQAYRVMEDQNVYVKKDSLNNKLFQNIEDRLGLDNFNPNLDTHKPIAQVLTQVKNMAADPFISFSKVEQMRSAVNDLRNSSDAATRRLAGSVVSEIDNYLSSLNPKDLLSLGGSPAEALNSVKQARKDWRNLSRAQTIEDALKSAQVSAERPTASESELIRTALLNLAKDKNKMRAFSESEQNAIKAVARGGSMDTLLTMMAKFNPERSQIVAGGALVGATTRPEIAIPVAAAGFTADKLQGFLRSRAGQQLVNQVASGTLQPIPSNMAWRGMLSGLTVTEP
jgi:hypothetical protein